MAEVKLTKNELREQQHRLNTLQKYLPTLQLKKAMLQTEIHDAKLELLGCEALFLQKKNAAKEYAPLLSMKHSHSLDNAAKVKVLHRRYENIAGVEVPYFDAIEFEPFSYDLFDTPVWFDSLVQEMRMLKEAWVKIQIAEEKKEALEKELRDVSIKVNLFEKILIPRASKNIKKIKIFLGDQQLAAVSQAKAAKTLIEEQKKNAY